MEKLPIFVKVFLLLRLWQRSAACNFSRIEVDRRDAPHLEGMEKIYHPKKSGWLCCPHLQKEKIHLGVGLGVRAIDNEKIGHHVITCKDVSKEEYSQPIQQSNIERELYKPLRRTAAGQGPCIDFCQGRGTF